MKIMPDITLVRDIDGDNYAVYVDGKLVYSAIFDDLNIDAVFEALDFEIVYHKEILAYIEWPDLLDDVDIEGVENA